MNLSRLKWACRRGMLELDLVLLPFAEHQYPIETPVIQVQFESLLSCSDQDLFDWLMGKKKAHQAYLEIVQKVRNYAQARSSY